ncbi:MAG: hypothetical protein JWP88_504 [Flaviaesturariibacter sp.]|nr:hypothetical protein [Flaviaesturariibacter sp.]
MARGLSANGDYVKALEFANKALLLASKDANKQVVQALIVKLKAVKTSIKDSQKNNKKGMYYICPFYYVC